MKNFTSKKWLLCLVLSLLVISSGLILGRMTKMSSQPVGHRLQWWLSAINWDTNRTKETGKDEESYGPEIRSFIHPLESG